MALPDWFITELTDKNDIVDIIQRNVALKKAGRLYKGLCPFHSERSPSFTVYPDTKSYYCFGCGRAGNVIRFTMDINSLSYIEAVRMLREGCGMQMPDEDDGQAKLKARILDMNKKAARWFYGNLTNGEGTEAVNYLRGRKLTDKTIREFGLGYGGTKPYALIDYLHSEHFTDEEITAGYLGKRGKENRVYGVFTGRVIYPIIDLRGNVIAFGGRRLRDDQGGPKYLNSSDTPVFKKSNGLFALNLAKKSGKKEFILCEGYMDVIAMHQAGFNNAIASLGTALTSQQARLISDYADKVIIAYDSDEAGQKATKKAMEIFDNFDVKVQVLQIPDAKDPDEFIKNNGKDRFEMLLSGASSALDFTLMKIKKDYDISNPDQRITYVSKACNVLATLNNSIQRDVYAQRIAEETNVDKSAILYQIQQIQRTKRFRDEKKMEADLIKNGIAQNVRVDYSAKGNTLSKVNTQQLIMCALLKENSFYSYINEQITADDFSDPEMKQAFIEFSKLVGQGNRVTYSVLSYHLNDSRAKTLAQAIGRNSDINFTKKDIEFYISNLVNAKLTRAERGEKSLDEIAQHISSLKEKKQ